MQKTPLKKAAKPEAPAARLLSPRRKTTQANTLVLCPALTSHSELSPEALKEADITPTTIRISVGDESPRELIGDFLQAARAAIDGELPGFSGKCMAAAAIDRMTDEVYADVHKRHAAAQPRFADCVK